MYVCVGSPTIGSASPIKGGVALSPALAVELDELLPQTENGTMSHVTVVVGETALLPCKAYSLGQRTVILLVKSIISC